MSFYLNATKQYLWDQFGGHQRQAQLLWKRDVKGFVGFEKPYEKNNAEKLGDWMLFPAVDLPTYSLFKNRLFQAFAAGSALTFIFLKFIDHPVFTTTLIGRTIAFLPTLVKILVGLSISGFVCRCLGRLFNTPLMKQFYAPNQRVKS